MFIDNYFFSDNTRSDLSNILQIASRYIEHLCSSNSIYSNIYAGVYVFNLRPLIFFITSLLLFKFSFLQDMSVIDYYFKKNRFKVFYHFISIAKKSRFWIYNSLPGSLKAFQISIADIFSSSIWLERECWDLFGVFFIGNVSLRRILTDYGFKSFPLRKDFPLTGYIELYFDLSSFMITYQPVSLAQELRFFNFNSSWEGVPRW